jgi:hypothetical protein
MFINCKYAKSKCAFLLNPFFGLLVAYFQNGQTQKRIPPLKISFIHFMINLRTPSKIQFKK